MYRYRAKIIKIVDGDTFDADVDLGFYMTARIRFRCLGYDAPELSGPEKEAGKAARALLEALIPVGGTYEIETRKADSFGRWLADVLVGDGLWLSQHFAEKFPYVR